LKENVIETNKSFKTELSDYNQMLKSLKVTRFWNWTYGQLDKLLGISLDEFAKKFSKIIGGSRRI
jgi:hypothetical protein